MSNAGMCVVALMVTLGVAPSAHAQVPTGTAAPQTTTGVDAIAFPTWELTGGYQLLRVPDQTFPFGLNVDGAWNLSSPLGLVGEIGWAWDSEDADGEDVTFDAWNIGAGPRWTGRGSDAVWPYAQILAGVLHARASAAIAGVDEDESETKLMLQPCIGVNIIAGDGWGVVGAVDYRRVFLDEDEDGESGENEFRVFVGLRLMLD